MERNDFNRLGQSFCMLPTWNMIYDIQNIAEGRMIHGAMLMTEYV